MSRAHRLTHAIVALCLMAGLAPVGAGAQTVPDAVDCAGPAGDPQPGTAEFAARDAINMYCAEQRHADQAQHPNFMTQPIPQVGNDDYRNPTRHDGARFRYTPMPIGGLAGEVYQPCAEDTCPNLVAGLATFEPPYPVVVVMHGLASRKEYHWWASQTLAENGYLVVAVDGTAGSVPGTALGWLHAEDNPFADDLDLDRIGVAGHSLGGGNALSTQGDERVSAIVSWDPCSSIPCGTAPTLPDPGHLTPTLYQMAEYTGWPGYPQPRTSVPDTLRTNGFASLRDRGVDTMVVTGRATTHLDWVGSPVWGSRYAELLWVYFNLAWFDRYLKGKLVLSGDETEAEEAAERAYRQAVAQEAFDRLTAEVFDDSADRHNISQGFYDPVQAALAADPLLGGNVPYEIAGMPVVDRLSFYHRSVCYVSAPDYGAGDGRPGAPVLVRADTTPDGNWRLEGCPVVP